MNIQSINQLAERLAHLFPPGMQEARDDLVATIRTTLQAGLGRLDLVTREEFDLQRSVLLKTREKLEALERQVRELERHGATGPG